MAVRVRMRMARRRWLKAKLRFGLRVKDGGIVATGVGVTGTVIVVDVAAMKPSVSRRASLRRLLLRMRALPVHRVMVRAMNWVKARLVPMADAGGVVVVAAGVGVAAMMSRQKVHGRLTRVLMFP
jgi:hypothetical protein